MSAPTAVVLSASQYSLYTLSVVEKLVRAGIAVRGICVRRLLNPSRFWQEYRRERSRLLAKIWKKLIVREKTSARRLNPWAPYLEKLQPPKRTVSALARHHGIPLVYCSTLNDRSVVEFLEQVKPTMVLFTGGGILRKPVLEQAGLGVLNCHMGILPAYRGMDVAEWALLEDHPDKLGLTVHLIDEGIDTGAILSFRPIPLQRDDVALGHLLDRYEPLMGEEIVEASVRFLRGEITPRRQRLEDGKQYFRLHPVLRQVAERKLAQYARLAAPS